MGVYVPRMKMPECCLLCPFEHMMTCTCDPDERFADTKKRKRPEWCPLIELPDHGDLIDRDALMEHECYVPLPLGNLPVIYRSYVKNAPAVIPAERSEDATD